MTPEILQIPDMVAAKEIFQNQKVLILGLPGSGKSTLIKGMGANEISLGAITRDTPPISPLGQEIARLYKTEKFWPSEFIFSLLSNEVVAHKDIGFVLDGIPRKDDEIDVVTRLLTDINTPKFDMLLYLKMNEQLAHTRRMSRKEVRPSTDDSYRLRSAFFLEGIPRWIEMLQPFYEVYVELDVTYIDIPQVQSSLANNLLK